MVLWVDNGTGIASGQDERFCSSDQTEETMMGDEEDGFDLHFLWQVPLGMFALWLIGMACVVGINAPPVGTTPWGP